MAAWFLDANHVVIPVIKHRLCIDYFLHNVAWLFSLITLLWSAVAVLFAAGSSPYFLGIAILSALAIPWLWYGERALGDRLAGHGYVYLCGLWFYVVALIWLGAAAMVQVRQVSPESRVE